VKQLIDSAETNLATADRSCPICELALGDAKSLHGHIALYLERFSLFSLPRSACDDDITSNAGESDKANIAVEGSRDDDFDSGLGSIFARDDDGTSITSRISQASATSAQHANLGNNKGSLERSSTILEQWDERDDNKPVGPSENSSSDILFEAVDTPLSLLESQDEEASSEKPSDRLEQFAQILARALAGYKRVANIEPFIEILPVLTSEGVLELRMEYKRVVKIGRPVKGVNIAKHIKLRLGYDENISLMKVCYVCALGKWESEAYWADYWQQSENSRSELLIEALMGRTNREIQQIKMSYSNKRFDDNLTTCMISELKNGKFKGAVLLILEEKRMENETQLDLDLVNNDVEELHKAVNNGIEDETAVINIILLRSDNHLREVLKSYEHVYQASFAKEIVKQKENLVVCIFPSTSHMLMFRTGISTVSCS
jgi:hypothetical protein